MAAVAAGYFGFERFKEFERERAGFTQVANGDAMFWLMQGPPNDRLIPCSIHYRFDRPVDAGLLRERLQAMVSRYRMLRRNVVEFDGLPYWQSAEPDWDVNFRILAPGEDMTALRAQADIEVSQASEAGKGVPLFRAYLSADGRDFVFVWHHVVSDLEGMFNKHALHIFGENKERTAFGYQLGPKGSEKQPGGDGDADDEPRIGALFDGRSRPIGFRNAEFDVERLVLPIEDRELARLGEGAGMPMSDIFSFITVRAVTLYHAEDEAAAKAEIGAIVSPLSLRKSSLDTDEGNNRTSKSFPVRFPLETTAAMFTRLSALPPTATSYDANGRMMKTARRLGFVEPAFREMAMPGYISNYFPLADASLALGDATVVQHDLRVPMVPYEQTKFAWSNYNGEVQLFLHTDPEIIDKQRMISSFRTASTDVLGFLKARSGP